MSVEIMKLRKEVAVSLAKLVTTLHGIQANPETAQLKLKKYEVSLVLGDTHYFALQFDGKEAFLPHGELFIDTYREFLLNNRFGRHLDLKGLLALNTSLSVFSPNPELNQN